MAIVLRPARVMPNTLETDDGKNLIQVSGVNAEAITALVLAAPALMIAGKHLAVKLAEVYRAAGAEPAECQAIREWTLALAKATRP